jgi:hypothetical protein
MNLIVVVVVGVVERLNRITNSVPVDSVDSEIVVGTGFGSDRITRLIGLVEVVDRKDLFPAAAAAVVVVEVDRINSSAVLEVVYPS